MGSIRCNRAAVCKLPTMAALSQLIPSRLYSPDELSPALLSAASAFGAQTQREAAVPPVFRMAGSTLAQKFRMGSQPDNVPFIPAPAEKKKIKLYSRDFYAVSTFTQPTRIWHAMQLSMPRGPTVGNAPHPERHHSGDGVNVPHAGLYPRRGAQLWAHSHCSHTLGRGQVQHANRPPEVQEHCLRVRHHSQGGRLGRPGQGMGAHSHRVLHSGRWKVRPLRVLQKVSTASFFCHILFAVTHLRAMSSLVV
jgi:hypothetical protein